METELTEKISYINTFISERPRHGIDSPHARIASAIKLNEELAEYFKDRAQVEDLYAKNLVKLSKKHYITNKSALGTFLPIWEMLQMELNRLATIHTEYASIITEEIEQPLRSAIQNNTNYATIHQLEEHLQKVAKEYDDLENKIQKHKKNTKGESKALEYIKQQEQKFAEWQKDAPQFLQQYQKIDEARLDNLKATVHKFESIQQTHAERVIELTGNSITAAATLRTDDEIASFCATHTSVKSTPHHHAPVVTVVAETIRDAPLINVEPIVPEPSMSESSLKPASPLPTPAPSYPPSIKKEKKRFFPAFTSIRRKPKSEAHQLDANRKRSLSHSESVVESLHSQQETTTEPSSPVSQNPPPLRNVSSFTGSFTNIPAPQPITQNQNPLIQVDSEGYSIPPPDRTVWIGDTTDSLIDTDDVNSDAGSMFSSPKIRVHIKSETVNEEDASQSAVVLTRVSTLLKEKNPSNSPTPRRLRGRREMRATQLYSVVEPSHLLTQITEAPPTDESAPISESSPTSTSAPLTNPFEITHEKTPDELPSIDVHITETVHLLSKGGQVEKSGIWGEISIEYNGPLAPETPVLFQLNTDRFEKLETTEFATQHQGMYQINTTMFEDRDRHVCIKYQTKLDHDRVPLVVKPMWKCEADKSRLLVKYHPAENITLNHVVFMTSVTGNVQNALSIPAGELMLAQKAIKWQLGDVDEESVIKAQFSTLEQGTPQPIAIRFELKDALLTNLDIQQQDVVRSVTRTVKAGKYIAEM